MEGRAKDRRRGGWYPIDNVIIDRFAKEIGSHGLSVYSVLARFAGRERTCWPSSTTIAQNLGLSRRTVIRALRAPGPSRPASLDRDFTIGYPASSLG